MKPITLFVVSFCLLQAHVMADVQIRSVPTFENCSLYIEGTDKIAPGDLKISYRKKGVESWLEAHPLSASKPEPTPRGSLFGLEADAEYEVRCATTDGRILAEQTFRTWADNVPIAQTIHLKDMAPQGSPILIDKSGTPEGWIRYVGEPGQVIEGGDEKEEAVLIKGAYYVIVENAAIHGGKRHGIQIENSNFIRIRNCDISGYGRVGEQRLDKDGKYYMPGEKKYINNDAGVYLNAVGQIVIERCYIHGPRNRANSWAFSHPAGPNAIFLNSKGGLVIRYNDLIGSENHRWNDVIEGYRNDKPDGGPNCDSDIYGNLLAFGNDDGIELDGGECNIRFYGNKIEGTLCGISTAPNVRGPSYIFNNLIANLGDETGRAGDGVKNGGGDSHSKGTTYFYHNIVFTSGHGLADVGYGKDANRGMFFGISRNNIFAVSRSGIRDKYAPPICDYDYDLFSTPYGGKGKYEVVRAVESHGVMADHGLSDPFSGNYELKANSTARDAGVAIAGFGSLQKTTKNMGLLPAAGNTPQIPLRPIQLISDKYQIVLTAAQNEEAAPEEKITLTAGNIPTGTSFKILRDANTAWLKVEPESGTIEPNSSLTLKVSLDRKPADSDKLLLGAVIIKLNSGDSLPITVYGYVAPAYLRKQFEAENCEGADGFTAVEDPAASGGKGLQFANAAGEAPGTKFLSVTVDAPEVGNYYLYLGFIKNEMYAWVNGTKSQIAPCFLVTPSGTQSLMAKKNAPQYVKLNKGGNTIKIVAVDELLLDQILVMNRPLFPGEMPQKNLSGKAAP